MEIAIIGATGRVGSRMAAEALSRGHTVTGIARDPAKSGAPDGTKLVAGDINDPDSVAPLIKGQEVVVLSAKFETVKAAPVLEAVRKAGVTRLFVVGGAGSLEVAPGKMLLDQPGFPDMAKPEAIPGAVFLVELRKVDDIDWTMLSPAAIFVPGERTGKFRIGGDEFMTDDEGKSTISMEDYAIAALDEIEEPKHIKQRFSVISA